MFVDFGIGFLQRSHLTGVGMCYKALTTPPLLRGGSCSSTSVGMELHVVLDVIPQVGTIWPARETVNPIFIEPLNPARKRPCASG